MTVVAAPVVIDIGRPDTWPVRMTRAEVALVLRCCDKTLRQRIKSGRVPKPDDGHTWSREDVALFARKTLKDFEREAKRKEAASLAPKTRRFLSSHLQAVGQ